MNLTNHNIAKILACFTVCGLASATMTDALTLETTADGYLARVEAGDTLAEAWQAIWSARSAADAVATGHDVIELGRGTFHWARSGGFEHRRPGPRSPFAPPLVVRGLGPDATTVVCTSPASATACASSSFGLTLEDLRLQSPEPLTAPLVQVRGAHLTLRRVWWTDQWAELPEGAGVLDVAGGRLAIERSVLADNRVTRGSLVHLAGQPAPTEGHILRSIVARNAAATIIRLSPRTVTLTVDHSTFADNSAPVVFRGEPGENAGLAVTIDRSIVTGPVGRDLELVIARSFVGGDPALADEGLSYMVPQPASPVVDALACDGEAVDQRGAPTGTRAEYWHRRRTACDIGAVEARHHGCHVTDRRTVACAEGERPLDQLLALGCRLLGDRLDCRQRSAPRRLAMRHNGRLRSFW